MRSSSSLPRIPRHRPDRTLCPENFPKREEVSEFLPSFFVYAASQQAEHFNVEKGKARSNRECRTKTAKAAPQHQGTAFLHALRRGRFIPTGEGKTPPEMERLTTAPREREEKQLSPHQFSPSLPPGGVLPPLPLMQRVAGAKTIPDARSAAAGARCTERQRIETHSVSN